VKVNYDTVMAVADAMYHKMREEEGRPQRDSYGIESSQIKAVVAALVQEINEVLK
jgi:hypothetical protein